jgi:CRISPR-associated protein Csx16
MTTYFVARHPGAIAWAAEHGVRVDVQLTHLDDPKSVLPGDRVIGILPVNLVADICERGARYWHLALDVPQDVRGKELTAAQMSEYGARIEEYQAKRVPPGDGAADGGAKWNR